MGLSLDLEQLRELLQQRNREIDALQRAKEELLRYRTESVALQAENQALKGLRFGILLYFFLNNSLGLILDEQ